MNNESTYDKLHKIGKKLGIEYASWGVDVPKNWDFSQEMFNGEITFTPRFGNKMYKLKNPTYAEVWKMLDTSIKETGDWDHIFIEEINLNGNTLSVFMGS